MIAPEVIHATITSYFAANNARDVEAFVSVFATDAALYNISENSPIIGHEAIRQATQQLLDPYSELDATINRIFTSDNGAAVFYTAHLITKNGRSATVEGIDVFEMNEDGKIQAIRYYIDVAAALALFS